MLCPNCNIEIKDYCMKCGYYANNIDVNRHYSLLLLLTENTGRGKYLSLEFSYQRF